jgi:hypothetical protein
MASKTAKRSTRQEPITLIRTLTGLRMAKRLWS